MKIKSIKTKLNNIELSKIKKVLNDRDQECTAQFMARHCRKGYIDKRAMVIATYFQPEGECGYGHENFISLTDDCGNDWTILLNESLNLK